MTRYYIEDAKCGFGTFVDGCGPHTTVASAVKYREDDGQIGWMYCVHPSGDWPIIGLYDKDVYEEIINAEFPEGPEYEAENFGGLSWDISEEGLFELFKNNPGNGAANLIHYAYDLCVCPRNMEDYLLALGKGSYSDEIEVPILDNEEYWLKYPDEF